MQVSIIIPVWNGETVISECLSALFRHSGVELLEVICVENASQDDSAGIIAENYPQVRLLRQPVNLGFAGGVNVGIGASQGDVFVLLNQDCLVHEGWLTAVNHAFTHDQTIGIVGGTIYNADGSVNHAGAIIQIPDAYGIHLTTIPSQETPQSVEYVTGAIFAIRRQTWEQTGPFDEGFYPAYFEESDYCYRARQKGYQTAYAPNVKATHLFSSREWEKDPIKHSANQHRSRYRFILKHFTIAQLNDFFSAEADAINQTDIHINQLEGRLLAVRDTLRDQTTITAARHHDLGLAVSREHQRLISVGFTRLLHLFWARAQTNTADMPDLLNQIADNKQAQESLRKLEHDVLTKIYFRDPNETEPESNSRRLWRLFVKRPFSIITLRDYRLLAQLNTLHVNRINLLTNMQQLLDERIDRRLTLLETLTDYEYR